MSSSNILKAEPIEFADRLNARCEMTKNEGRRMVPRLLPIAAERINFPVIEKKLTHSGSA